MPIYQASPVATGGLWWA